MMNGIASISAKRYTKDMNYKIVIHREPQGGFWAEVPVLPGCVSHGDTLPELKGSIREAIEGYLEVMMEEGREPERDVEIDEVAV
jgi:predicted RNase H-like HicB family nuclease